MSFLIAQTYLLTNFYIKSKQTQYGSPCLMIILEVNQALIRIIVCLIWKDYATEQEEHDRVALPQQLTCALKLTTLLYSLKEGEMIMTNIPSHLGGSSQPQEALSN